MLNINFPSKPSRKVKFAKQLGDITRYFNYPHYIDMQGQIFRYSDSYSKDLDEDVNYDVGSVFKGYITISLFKSTMDDEEAFDKMKNVEFSL